MNLRPTMPAAALAPRATFGESPVRAGALASAVLGARVYVDIVVPRTSVAAKLRVLGSAETAAATTEARLAMTDDGFPTTMAAHGELGGSDRWNFEMVTRQLAIAVRDAASPDRPLAGVDEWQSCDEDQLAALWTRLQDLEAELNPLGDSAPELTDADIAAITDAAKKKALTALVSFGSLKLARFAITSAVPPASSPTPKS